MSLKTISPAEAKVLMNQGAVLVDIRDGDEHVREHIPGVTQLPLSEIKQGRPEIENPRAVIYHCPSGARTMANAEALKQAANCEAYVVEGGLDRKQPLSLIRQAQIGAGGLVILGIALGYLASPWFLLLSGFVGAGLLQAGITGWCGMASLLQVMPWNSPRRARS